MRVEGGSQSQDSRFQGDSLMLFMPCGDCEKALRPAVCSHLVDGMSLSSVDGALEE